MKLKTTFLVAIATLYLNLFSPFGVTKGNCNNLSITSVVYDASVTPGRVIFSISWENSWNTVGVSAPYNYDAVWVFVKYQGACAASPPASSPWTHATLNTTSSNHSATGGPSADSLTVDAVSDGMGVFIRRKNPGYGFTQVWSCTLKLATPTTATCPSGQCNWKVFGIEMVNIPVNSFSVGDGSGTTTNPFTNQSIASEALIAAAALYGGSPEVPAAYPKGYQAFYSMKHEISQQEYVSFLNTLQFAEQQSRTALAPDYIYDYYALTPTTLTISNRNTVKMRTIGASPNTPATYGCDLDDDNTYDEITQDGLHIACNYLSWADLAAFLDWAALRPMTEMEYEKICRGVTASLADEYPWGSTDLTSAVISTLNNPGNTSEAPLARPSNGLCVYNNDGAVVTNGPIRIGASPYTTTGRVKAAAGYYGVLDMAGNVWEHLVAVDATGVSFVGTTFGNGALDASGNANVTNWPSNTTGAGSGARGGSWATQAADNKQLRTSDRTNATTPMTTRNKEYGGRGVR